MPLQWGDWNGNLGDVDAEVDPSVGGWSVATVMRKDDGAGLNFWYHPLGYLVDAETGAVADAEDFTTGAANPQISWYLSEVEGFEDYDYDYHKFVFYIDS